MQVNTLVDHYITHESVLDDTSQWLADITDAHGLHGLSIVALLIRRLARDTPARTVTATPMDAESTGGRRPRRILHI